MPATATITPEALRRYLQREARMWGMQVKTRRSVLGFTLEQLAERAFTTPQTIHKIERGQIVVRDHVRLAVALALGCEVDDLFPNPRRVDVMKDVA